MVHHGGTSKEECGNLVCACGQVDVTDMDSCRLFGVEIARAIKKMDYKTNL